MGLSIKQGKQQNASLETIKFSEENWEQKPL